MSSGLTKKQQQLVNDTINKYVSDQLVYHDLADVCVSADPTKKLKMQQSIITVSRFRIFTFLKGSKFDKEFPILQLAEISGKSKQAVFRFNVTGKPPICLVVTAECTPKIVFHVREAFRRMTYGWPKSKVYLYKYEGSESLSSKEFHPGLAHGFEATYEAYCNLNGTPVRSDVVEYVKDLASQGITDFDLTACPGVDLKSDLTFEIFPIASALRNNTYWKGLEIRGVEHKEVAAAISLILTENRTLTRVVCSNCSSEVTDALGLAMQQNPYNKVRILDFSGNKFAAKSVEAFALGIQHCPHIIEVINLNESGMNAAGLQALVNSCTINWGLTLGIEELNISNNLVTTASTEFIQFMSNMRKHSKLKRLSIAGTGIAVGSLILELGFLKLTYLDISDNKFDKLTQTNLVHFCENTISLETMRLANTGLGGQMISRILKTLFDNESIKNLSIDISRNALGTQGISTIAPYLKNATLICFDVSENAIKEKGAIELIKNIKYVQRLILDRNWGRDDKDAEDLSIALGSFITSHPEVYHISIAGTSGNRLGRALKAFFVDLKGNTSLEELDITGNAIGDSIFSIFCSSLPKCNIKSIRCDNNGITTNGYMSLRRAIPKSTSFMHFDFPIIDYDSMESRLKPKFLEILLDLVRSLSVRNKDKAPVWRSNLFDFDLKWPTPLGLVPLMTVVPELATISSKLYEGPRPVLPPEEPIEEPASISPPVSTRISSKEDDEPPPRPTSTIKKGKLTAPQQRKKTKRDKEKGDTLSRKISSTEPPPPNYCPGLPPPTEEPPPLHTSSSSSIPPPSEAPPAPIVVPPPAEVPPPIKIITPSLMEEPMISKNPPPPSDLPPPPVDDISHNKDDDSGENGEKSQTSSSKSSKSGKKKKKADTQESKSSNDEKVDDYHAHHDTSSQDGKEDSQEIEVDQ